MPTFIHKYPLGAIKPNSVEWQLIMAAMVCDRLEIDIHAHLHETQEVIAFLGEKCKDGV